MTMQEQLQALNKLGWSDNRIAREIESHPNTVYAWRVGARTPLGPARILVNQLLGKENRRLKKAAKKSEVLGGSKDGSRDQSVRRLLDGVTFENGEVGAGRNLVDGLFRNNVKNQ